MSVLKKLTGLFSGEQPSDDLNFAELIILAGLGKKLESDPSEKGKLIHSAKCVFDSKAQGDKELSLDKFSDLLKEGTGRSSNVEKEQIIGAFKLLGSGQAENDVKDTLFTLLKSIPGIPGQIVNDIPNIFHKPTDLPRLPGFDVASKTAVAIMRPDKDDADKNRIFRLAILAYARMNGINIEEKNLLDLCDFLESGTEDDFTKLVENGLETMKDQYGVTDIQMAAKKFHSISQACMSKAT